MNILMNISYVSLLEAFAVALLVELEVHLPMVGGVNQLCGNFVCLAANEQ